MTLNLSPNALDDAGAVARHLIGRLVTVVSVTVIRPDYVEMAVATANDRLRAIELLGLDPIGSGAYYETNGRGHIKHAGDWQGIAVVVRGPMTDGAPS